MNYKFTQFLKDFQGLDANSAYLKYCTMWDDTLNGDDVDIVCDIIKAGINIHQGNLTSHEYAMALRNVYDKHNLSKRLGDLNV